MEYNYLHLTKSDNCAIVEIDRPPVNALNTDVVVEISQLFQELESDPEVSAVILIGRGKAFVAGADISEMENMSSAEAEQFSARGQNAMNAVANIPKPVIAAINGFALGGGCELALACDIRLAAPDASIGQPEVKLGVIPGFGGTQRLSRTVGPGTAKELIFSGKTLNAAEALAAGLVDRVVGSASELMPEAKALAAQICNNSPSAVTEAKKLINDGLDVPLNAGLEMEKTAFAELFGTPDQIEGMKAFLEKRKPKFQNK
ncbi:MAG: enoyl-CoA hydratase/isomerase family protein [Thermoplasmata archaeon]|nr:MAG: enoyl-CoA hydratase/isomerase family protein [Thermoplasmata archaeon]